MFDAREMLRQITALMRQLIEMQLCSDQNFPYIDRSTGNRIELRMGDYRAKGMPSHNIPYEQVYDEFNQARYFAIKMLDGALVQIQYEFKRDTILKHTLGFLPSPHLEEFQNSPEIYLEDSIFAEVVKRNIVPFPIRFDFDAASASDLVHPSSHLTLGQYKNCRIPVSAPLTPYYFLDFILRNFYYTAHEEYAGGLPVYSDSFSDSITELETKVVHIKIPRG